MSTSFDANINHEPSFGGTVSGGGGGGLTAPVDPVLIADGSVNALEFQALANVTSDIQAQISASRSRANHTGTQLAETISDFDTQVHLSRLDQLTPPTTSLNLNNQKITGLSPGTSPTDVPNLGQVQASAAGIDAKASVRFATTGNITLSGLGTGSGRDWGSDLNSDDRILVKNQTLAQENGIYNAKLGAWVRSSDMDSDAEYTSNAFTFVEDSASNLITTQWIVSNSSGTIVVGTTPVLWVQFSAGNTYTVDSAGGIALTGNSFSILTPVSSGLIKDVTGIYVDPTIVLRKYVSNIGNGVDTTITVTHNLNSRDITFNIYKNSSPFNVIYVACDYTSVNTLTLYFSTAPITNEYRIAVQS